MSAGGGVPKKLLRVVWIPLVTTFLAVALAAGLMTTTGQSEVAFRSQLLVLVPATPPPSAPVEADPSEVTSTTAFDPLGRPTEALRAASNYAEVIPQDQQIRQLVAAAARMDPDDVIGRIEASAVPDSSLIVITFVASSAEASEAGIEAIENAIVGAQPATPAISPQSLIVVSTSDAESVGGGGGRLIASALVLGAVFGVFLAFVWARTNARIDGMDDLREFSDWPVVDLDGVPEFDVSATAAAIRRSVDLGAGGNGATSDGKVSVVPVNEASSEGARRAVARLERSRHAGTATSHLFVTYAGLPGTPASISSSVDADWSLLAVVRGSRVSDVRAAVAEMSRLGKERGALLIVPTAGAGSGREEPPPIS